MRNLLLSILLLQPAAPLTGHHTSEVLALQVMAGTFRNAALSVETSSPLSGDSLLHRRSYRRSEEGAGSFQIQSSEVAAAGMDPRTEANLHYGRRIAECSLRCATVHGLAASRHDRQVRQRAGTQARPATSELLSSTPKGGDAAASSPAMQQHTTSPRGNGPRSGDALTATSQGRTELRWLPTPLRFAINRNPLRSAFGDASLLKMTPSLRLIAEDFGGEA